MTEDGNDASLEDQIGRRRRQNEPPAVVRAEATQTDQLRDRKRNGIHIRQPRQSGDDVQAPVAKAILRKSHGQQNRRIKQAEENRHKDCWSKGGSIKSNSLGR